jgi:hypothetical protein
MLCVVDLAAGELDQFLGQIADWFARAEPGAQVRR